MDEKIQWFVITGYSYEGLDVQAYNTEEEAHKEYDFAKYKGGYTFAVAIIKGAVIEGALDD